MNYTHLQRKINRVVYESRSAKFKSSYSHYILSIHLSPKTLEWYKLESYKILMKEKL